ncbi:MAG: hypothetical protein WBX27_14840 [Specibacter sp.]
MNTAVDSSTVRTPSLTILLMVLVNALGAVALLLPAAWTALSLGDMSGAGRGDSDLDNAIRGEENLKVALSLAVFIAVSLFFLSVDCTILAVRKQLRYGKAWMTAVTVLLLPPVVLFGYATVASA